MQSGLWRRSTHIKFLLRTIRMFLGTVLTDILFRLGQMATVLALGMHVRLMIVHAEN
jgi:hypothetical protein